MNADYNIAEIPTDDSTDDSPEFKRISRDPDAYLRNAKKAVLLSLCKSDLYALNVDIDDLYIVWFSKTLQDWKALISTDVTKGLYFEVTHNGATFETYVDMYSKLGNVTITDDVLNN